MKKVSKLNRNITIPNSRNLLSA